MNTSISIRNARLHNLKNISLEIPRNQLVVLTGISGSGKSTLAFDILHRESQRQYMEALGLVTWGVSKPPLDSLRGLPPSISLDQHLTHHNPRSTVGTLTEVFTYLRVLFARLGHRPCPNCGKDLQPPTFATEWRDETEDDPESAYACPYCDEDVPGLGMANFSFNKPAGACPTCTGLGVVRQVIISRVVDESKSMIEGAVAGWLDVQISYYCGILKNAGRYYGFEFDAHKAIQDYTPIQRDLLLYGTESPQFKRHFPDAKPPATTRQGRFEGIVPSLERRYNEHAENAKYREKLDALFSIQRCLDCEGTRLRPQSRAVTVAGASIVEVSRLTIHELEHWLKRLPDRLRLEELPIARPILDDLQERIKRLLEVGVGYLNLERSAPTLSAGETQRLRLAALLGSSLVGMLYILDEPTVGLHPRDTGRLIGILRHLRDLGNTVLVVEHDLDVIRAADYVIDMGPGAGKHGGQIVATGSPEEISQNNQSLTGAFLCGKMQVPYPGQRRPKTGSALTIEGACQFNLKNLTVQIPLGIFVGITGVSGSGKSTLIFEILGTAAHQRLNGANRLPGRHDSISGWEAIDKVITIDQGSIGRIPRSNMATYTEIFTPIREAFAASPDGRAQKAAARLFSFNTPGGRCERCEGSGVLSIKMHFLPDVEVQCPACHGRRFRPEVLAIRFGGVDISEVLEMTVEEALALFADLPSARSRLQVLSDAGLGYLQLGQPVPTLSGGEAQRIKLARELGRRATGRTLYLLDEPTKGLHPADSAHLLEVLQKLVEHGNSVVVVEHNLDIIKAADWLIDLGPEGGEAGGQIMAEGTPEEVARIEKSQTGHYLKVVLQP